MLLSTKQIHDGWHNGTEVWISTVSYLNYGKRQHRNLKPTKVKILSATTLQRSVRWNYQLAGSLSYFLDEKGTIIGLYTRGKYGRIEIPAFTEKNECFEHYRLCCNEAIEGLTDWLAVETKRVQKAKEDLVKLNLQFIPVYDEI